ncbi:TPA: DUF551 domain-containing protein [Klebsiella aerogenes]|nr:DUF551 domain-containing protein [Klebsiella aerogenes]
MVDEIISELDAEESACRATMPQELQKSAGALNNFRSSENVQAENPTKWWDGLYGGIKGRGQRSEGNFIPDLGMSTEDIIDSINKSHVSDAGNSPVIPDTWIPVSERLPEEGGRYWCYVEEQNSLGKSHYQWNCSWNGEIWGGAMMYGRVTHWMPLPNPPKE